MPEPTPICVRSDQAALAAEVAALAERLGLPPCRSDCTGFALVRTDARLELHPCSGGGAVWSELSARFGSGLLGRAAGRARPRSGDVAVDATAGLGGDAVALAALGYRVLALERSPLVAALLADGLRRLGERGPELAARIELIEGDGRDLLSSLAPPDLVLLDPMFPRRGKRARTRKGMQALRALLTDDDAAAVELLAAARAHALRRVVVKRPLRSAPLGGVRPSGAVQGTTVRFDLYPPTAPPPGASEARSR